MLYFTLSQRSESRRIIIKNNNYRMFKKSTIFNKNNYKIELRPAPSLSTITNSVHEQRYESLQHSLH